MSNPKLNIQHSMLTGVHYTPEVIAKLSHTVLGGIDLDPCSHKQANKVIQAKEYFTKYDNGLKQEWTKRIVTHTRLDSADLFTCKHEPASIFINAPGSKYIKPSLPMQFWKRLMQQREKGNIRHAIWVCYSLEQLQQSQNLGCLSMVKFLKCIPKKRIKFLDCQLQEEDSPTHGNAIIYVPALEDASDLFYEEFQVIGDIR